MGETVASYLVIERATTKEQVGQRIDVPAYPFTLGRTIPILSVEQEVSRRHAEVNFDPNSKVFTITDLKSTNGVTLDGKKIEPSRPYEIRVGIANRFGEDGYRQARSLALNPARKMTLQERTPQKRGSLFIISHRHAALPPGLPRSSRPAVRGLPGAAPPCQLEP